MNEQDKELLIKDLYARLPYGFIVKEEYGDYIHVNIYNAHLEHLIDRISLGLDKLVLRPMSSMTEEEIRKYHSYCECNDCDFNGEVLYFDTIKSFDYLNSIHVDYRGLIEKGPALKAPKDMYKTES